VQHSSPHAEDADKPKRTAGWHQLGDLLPDADSPRNLVVLWALEASHDAVLCAPLADAVLRHVESCGNLALAVTGVRQCADFSDKLEPAGRAAIPLMRSACLLNSAASDASGRACAACDPAVSLCGCRAGTCKAGVWAWCHLRGNLF
jgi:hypothetical protein